MIFNLSIADSVSASNNKKPLVAKGFFVAMQKIDTIAYYDSHAGNFFSDTQRVDMAPIYQRFLPHLPRGAHILDAGCGSGRDSKAFLARGYRVTAFDASLKLVELAQAHTGLPIAQRRFEDVDEVSIYDGIWACASLLHLPESELVPTLQRLWQALKPSGVFYLSFKYGESEREHQGRHFTDATESRLTHWLSKLTELAEVETWITVDQRPERTERWLNALLHRAPSSKRGREIIEHKKTGRKIHLFVRENRLSAGKAAAFTYHGPVDYVSHQGSEPMSVIFTLPNKI